MDPLTQAAESMAPAQATTNFFGSAAGNNVLARYGQAAMEAPSADRLADAGSQLADSQFERVDRRRKMQTWDREDEEYEEKKEFKVMRGDFLDNIAKIDATADNYEETMAELLTTLPPEALKDDAVLAIKASKDRVFEKGLQEKKESRGRQEAFQNQQKMQLQKDTVKAALSGLSPEELETHRDPVTKELDVASAMYAAGQKKRELDMGEFKEKQDVLQENRKELRASTELSKELKADKAKAEDFIRGDQTAFPSAQTELLEKVNADRVKVGQKPVTMDFLKDLDAEGLKKAQMQDAAAEERWLIRASDTESPGEFIAKYGKNLTPQQKDRYRHVWRVAQGVVKPSAPNETAPPAAPGGGPAGASAGAPAGASAPSAPANSVSIVSVKVINGRRVGKTSDGRYIDMDAQKK